LPGASGGVGDGVLEVTSLTAKTGEGPSAGVLLDSAGDIFGTAVTAGAQHDGTPFKLTP
jgi:hypothetical protein